MENRYNRNRIYAFVYRRDPMFFFIESARWTILPCRHVPTIVNCRDVTPHKFNQVHATVGEKERLCAHDFVDGFDFDYNFVPPIGMTICRAV